MLKLTLEEQLPLKMHKVSKVRNRDQKLEILAEMGQYAFSTNYQC